VIDGIRAAASGGARISPAIALIFLRRLFREAGTGVDAAGVELSGREHEVLDGVVAGSSDHEIADTLGMTVEALRGHAARILAKLHAAGRVEPGLRAYRRRHG
jgi:DNA-binding NarL/FixJ family response regulator